MAGKSNESIIKDKAIIGAKIENMLTNGRVEIDAKDIQKLLEYPVGSLITFIDDLNIYRIGGFLISTSDDHFVYIKPNLKNKFEIKYSNVKKIYVGDVYKTKNDLVSIVETTRPVTKFPISVNNVIIFYGNDSFDYKRFKHTQKYKLIMGWYNYFNKIEE